MTYQGTGCAQDALVINPSTFRSKGKSQQEKAEL